MYYIYNEANSAWQSNLIGIPVDLAMCTLFTYSINCLRYMQIKN